MEPQKGFYSLVQFCPDRGRAEAVNIGLVLFVPSLAFLEVRTAANSRRVAQVFGKAAVDPQWLRTARESFSQGLRTEHKSGRFSSQEDLDKYLATLGNDIVPTPARPVRVEDPAAEMDRLFARFVEHGSASEQTSSLPVAQPLEDAFMYLRAKRVPVGVGRIFQIEGLGFSVRSNYDYRNGTVNLIRLLRVGSQRPNRAIKEAIDLGGESIQVEKHLRVDGANAKLIVVVAPELIDARSAAVEVEIQRLDADYPAEFVRSQDIPALAERIKADAH